MEEVLQKLLGLLDRLVEERGVPAGDASVDKNIIKAPNSTLDNGKKPSGNISPNERKRLKETFNLFNKMFFDHKKKEEPDKKEGTKLSEISKRQVSAKQQSEKSKGGFGGILGGILPLIMGLSAFVTGILTDGPFKGSLKILSKIGTANIGDIVSKFLGKFSKTLKKVPIIGLLISLGFAYTRFKNGDIVGGSIDILSGLASLIPVAGTTISIGLDLLNAFLDAKSDNGPGKPKTSKLDILKDMASSIGTWIWERRKYIPILAPIGRFVDAWNSFKSGNITDGLSNLGWGMASFLTGGDAEMMLDGFGAFMGFFESTPSVPGEAPKANSSFMDDIAALISEKLAAVWKWMTDTIKEGIMRFVPGGEKILEFGKDFVDESKKIYGDVKSRVVEFGKDFVDESKALGKEVWSKVEPTIGRFVEFGKDFVEESKAVGKEVWDKVTTVTGGLVDSAKGMLKTANDGIGSMIEDAKDAILPEGDRDPLSLLGKSILTMMGKTPKGQQAGVVGPNNAVANTTNPSNSTNTVGGESPKDVATILNKSTDENKDMFEKLYQANLTANQLLATIAANTARAFGGGGSNSNTGIGNAVNIPMNTSKPDSPMVTMPSNRGSFLSSPYAI